jgi:hypothetical protein
MIAYDLQCENGHAFEGWFEDRKAFFAQRKKGLISCPVCNTTEIVQLPSKFAIKTSRGFRSKPVEPSQELILDKIGKEVSEFVEKNFDDVGSNFAREALKIHYGATEPRNIRGVSTHAEEKLLSEEGVPYLKVPIPARPQTDS